MRWETRPAPDHACGALFRVGTPARSVDGVVCNRAPHAREVAHEATVTAPSGRVCKVVWS